MKKLISILGSTGSVGLNTLKIIDRKKDKFEFLLLSANKNFKLICKQIKNYKPKYFIITDKYIFEKAKKKFNTSKTLLLNDFKDVNLKKKNDLSILAIPGLAGLQPTIKMIKLSKKILIANKESIICGWNIIKKNAKAYKTSIIPVDSEHFSIFQLLKKYELRHINKIYITASGGPFLNYSFNKLKNVKPKEALKHPKWKMGKKISIDSATMMNKIFELIEAQKLFDIPQNKLDILIHPESLVHAIVELKNGLVQFIYHETSMIIPIANAIYDGKININKFLKIKKKKNYIGIRDLNFRSVKQRIFPVVKIKNRINEYPSTPIIINACNEILVDQFLQKKIPFLSISKIIMGILNDKNYRKYAIKTPKNINQIFKIDLWARNKTKEFIN